MNKLPNSLLSVMGYNNTDLAIGRATGLPTFTESYRQNDISANIPMGAFHSTAFYWRTTPALVLHMEGLIDFDDLYSTVACSDGLSP